MPRNQSTADHSILERYQSELKTPGSYFNLIIGLLIVLIAGVLVMNYFKNSASDLGPAQQITNNQTTPPDVKPDSLPGKYTVKDGDTLFTIADKYYQDGYQYGYLVVENKLDNPNIITIGQVLTIPVIKTPTIAGGTGGAENQTIWGEKITTDSYVVIQDDWLSKIAGRAYGDPMQFDKLTKANNIANPDLIEPGTTLKIPR